MLISLSFAAGSIIYGVYYKHPVTHTNIYCKVWYYVQQALPMMYRYMLAAACVDRCVLSSTNAGLRGFANVKIARRIVMAIILIWLVLPIPLLVFYNLIAGACFITVGYAATLYNGIFSLINACGIPIPIMIICLFLIRKNLASKRERRQNITHQPQATDAKQRLQEKRDQQALAMLFIQIVVYIIFTTPWMILSFYSAVSLSIQNKSADQLVLEQFLSNVAGLILFLFPTASFYLYTLTSNMFRQELAVMLHSVFCFKCCINNQRVAPQPTPAI